MSDPTSPQSQPQVMTRESFACRLEEEVNALDAGTRGIFNMFAIPPVRAVHRWQYDDRVIEAPVWLVAMSGNAVIGYDEVEDEYGVGTAREGPVTDGHVIDDWGTFGERLRWTLLRFPNIIVSEPPPRD